MNEHTCGNMQQVSTLWVTVFCFPVPWLSLLMSHQNIWPGLGLDFDWTVETSGFFSFQLLCCKILTCFMTQFGPVFSCWTHGLIIELRSCTTSPYHQLTLHHHAWQLVWCIRDDTLGLGQSKCGVITKHLHLHVFRKENRDWLLIVVTQMCQLKATFRSVCAALG